jgi:prephenate dehydratase
VKARLDWHAKSGRRLSAATRERLVSHPETLRQLAEVLDELLTVAEPVDPDSKSVTAALIEVELTRSRLLGVPITN